MAAAAAGAKIGMTQQAENEYATQDPGFQFDATADLGGARDLRAETPEREEQERQAAQAAQKNQQHHHHDQQDQQQQEKPQDEGHREQPPASTRQPRAASTKVCGCGK
mgnify:CR=1 FL=1